MTYKDTDKILDKLDMELSGDITEEFDNGIQTAINIIVNEPTPDISRPIARWEMSTKYDWGDTFYHCSECGNREKLMTNYCSFCGAYMVSQYDLGECKEDDD